VPSDWTLRGNLADIGRSGGGFAAVNLDYRSGDERGEVTDGEQHDTGNFVSNSEKSDQETDAPVNGSRRRPPSLVVGIGPSAGGLAAYRSFFDHMPHDTGMLFILVQHRLWERSAESERHEL
jgi:chemotaxis response regulator CheB